MLLHQLVEPIRRDFRLRLRGCFAHEGGRDFRGSFFRLLLVRFGYWLDRLVESRQQLRRLLRGFGNRDLELLGREDLHPVSDHHALLVPFGRDNDLHGPGLERELAERMKRIWPFGLAHLVYHQRLLAVSRLHEHDRLLGAIRPRCVRQQDLIRPRFLHFHRERHPLPFAASRVLIALAQERLGMDRFRPRPFDLRRRIILHQTRQRSWIDTALGGQSSRN